MADNADVVVAIAEAVERRDLEALLTHLDEDIEHHDARVSAVRRGRAAIRQHFLELWTESPEAAFAVDEVVKAGDWVIARQDWRGLAGGDVSTWVARRFRNAKVRRIDVCATRAEAFEAAGLAVIEDAFGSLDRPGNDELLHEQCADDGDLLELYEIEGWREMTDEQVIRNYAAPSFLSPAGFRYFLPAFMSFGLRNPDTPEIVVESTVFHLAPYGELDEFVRSKFTLFTPAQREATRLFLEAMTPYHDTTAALDFWSRSGEPDVDHPQGG